MKKRNSATLNGTLLSLAILGIGAGVYFYSSSLKEQSNPQNKEADLTHLPSQYSDRHITENAILSDPRFKDSVTLRKEDYLASVFSPIKKKGEQSKNTLPERGTWLWTPILEITQSYRDSIISGASKNGIRTIYLSIDSYLDIFVLPEGEHKRAKKEAFDKVVSDFIAKAHESGISVDAEAGWRNWAEREHQYKAIAILEYVKEYNHTHPDKFRGLQYDIEPYLLPSYEQDKKTVLKNFISLVNELVAELEEEDLELSIAIPEFYDEASPETPKFFYGFRYDFTFNHLLNALERKTGSKIIIMAYRNRALGENGSVEISQNEITSASEYQTKIIVAQETGGDLPPHITFHGTSLSYFREQTSLIEKSFANESSYGGLATHYVNAMLLLK